MSLEDISTLTLVIVLFVVSFIFSFVAYMEKNIGKLTRDNRVKMYERGALHSTIGALVAVVVYAVLVEYRPEMNFLLKVALSVLGAVINDTLILRARKEIGGRDD